MLFYFYGEYLKDFTNSGNHKGGVGKSGTLGAVGGCLTFPLRFIRGVAAFTFLQEDKNCFPVCLVLYTDLYGSLMRLIRSYMQKRQPAVETLNQVSHQG